MYVAIDVEEGICVAFNKELSSSFVACIESYLNANPDMSEDEIYIYSLCPNLKVTKRAVAIVDITEED